MASTDNRPTSPHLSIYRPQISSVLSILHRISGIWLSFGAAVLVAWLYIVAYAPTFYPEFHAYMASFFGQLFLMSWAAAFYYHLLSGIRHLFWDIGMGYAIPQVNRSGWAVVLATAALTLLTWGFIQGGAA